MIRIRTAAIIGTIVAGAMMSTTGVTVASAAPMSTTTAAAVTSAPSPALAGSIRSAGGAATGAPAASDGISTNGIPIGTIINWIKKNASSLMTPMKKAVKSGIAGFKRWWAGVAGWIKTAINAIVTMTIQELFNALWNYFF